MRGADLKEAILINTNFGRAFLDEADLREAFLFYSEPREFWRYDKEEEDKAEKDLEGAYCEFKRDKCSRNRFKGNRTD